MEKEGALEVPTLFSELKSAAARPVPLLCQLPHSGHIIQYHLHQRFSTFLMLRPLNTVPHVLVTRNYKII